jgi:SAM-dependent methyltransferase
MTSDHARAYVDWKGWDADAFGRCSDQEALTFDAEWRRLGLGGPRGRRVLELGFGNGAFAGWCRSRGAEWTGVEADAVCVGRAVAAGHAARGTLPVEREFDAICAFDVFEHVPQDELPPLLTALAALLAPDGRLLARFPNGDSPLGLPLQYGDWTHRTVIGEGRWKQLAFETGFECPAWLPPALPLRWQDPVRALRRTAMTVLYAALSRAVRTLVHPGSRWVAAPNVVAHLRRRGA